MNRPPPYADASINRYDGQISTFPAQPQFPSRGDGRQQWNANPQMELNPVSSHPIQERIANRKGSYENQANDPRMQSYEQDMEIGYEDNKPSELTFEGLEQKLQDEIMKVIKDQSVLEDEEIVRHKERMVEINTRYQEKLSSLRVQQAAQIGEFLRKESQARLNHYQQTAVSTRLTERIPVGPVQPVGSVGPVGPRDHGWSMASEPPRSYATMPTDNYRERPEYREPKRNQGSEGRVPYPHGRVYNNSDLTNGYTNGLDKIVSEFHGMLMLKTAERSANSKLERSKSKQILMIKAKGGIVKNKTIIAKGKAKVGSSNKDEGKGKIFEDAVCFSCNEKGHWKRNCPTLLAENKKRKANGVGAKVGSSNKDEGMGKIPEDAICFNCNEKGHWKRNCPTLPLTEHKKHKKQKVNGVGALGSKK